MNKKELAELAKDNREYGEIARFLSEFMGYSGSNSSSSPTNLSKTSVKGGIDKALARLSDQADTYMEIAEHPKASQEQRDQAKGELEEIIPKLEELYKSRRELS